MSKYAIVALLAVICGCVPVEMRDMVMPVNDDWRAEFGDSPESHLYYNLALTQRVVNTQSETIEQLRAAVNNHAAIINSNRAALGGATTQPATQPTTQPN